MESSVVSSGSSRASSSVNSQMYAIPIPDNMSDGSVSTSSGGEEDNDEGDDDYDTSRSDSASDTDAVDSEDDQFLDRLDLQASNTHLMEGQDVGLGADSMFDVSHYLLSTLTDSLNNVDFSQALALQAKTSAVLNSKSMELKRLIDTSKTRLVQLQDRFDRGVQTSRQVKENLRYAKTSIDKLSAKLRTEHPIEFNEAREHVLENRLASETN